MTEVSYQPIGDTYLIAGKVTATTLSKGAETTKSFRVSMIWVQENGQWKRAGFHDTIIE